jgi:PhnB protein
MSSTTIPSIAPWLTVPDAQKAVEYYKAAFGAVELYRLPADDGSLAVAQLSVDDPDSVFDQAVGAGAAVVAPIHEEYGWRTGRVTDPFGHDWEMSKQLTS